MSMYSISKDLANVNIEIEEGTGEILQEPQFALKKKANEKLAPIIKKSINTEYDREGIYVICRVR